MKVHLIKETTIWNYTDNNANSLIPFNEWLSKLKNADWNTPTDIKGSFGSADLLGNSTNRVVFDIGGNNFRMICKYHFGKTKVHLFICWIGTHAEYDKINKQNKQYTIQIY